MRIKISFTKNTESVPNNLNVVNSYIHKCLGNDNKYHDIQSNYSISRLMSGEIVDGGKNINYHNGGYILISSTDTKFLDDLLMGVLKNKVMGFGMEFNGVSYINEDFYSGWNYFKTTDMGFMLKKPKDYVYDDNDKHKGYYTLFDKNITDILKTHIINKFGKINPKFDFSDLEIVIEEHPKHCVKYRYSKHIKNSVNICQINIKTNRVLAESIYNYGIGQSCGSGFGTIYTTQFHDHYK